MEIVRLSVGEAVSVTDDESEWEAVLLSVLESVADSVWLLVFDCSSENVGVPLVVVVAVVDCEVLVLRVSLAEPERDVLTVVVKLESFVWLAEGYAGEGLIVRVSDIVLVVVSVSDAVREISYERLRDADHDAEGTSVLDADHVARDHEGATLLVADNTSVSVPVVPSLFENVTLPVSHSISLRHPMYPWLFPKTGLHRPPCCVHQWQPEKLSHTDCCRTTSAQLFGQPTAVACCGAHEARDGHH